MRGNGLTADDYAPIGELDRSAASDALLALREAGVAAYAVLPAEAHPQQGTPSTQGTQSATVYADRAALDRAREVVRMLDPSTGTPAPATPPAGAPIDDAAWQQIVAGFDATAPEPHPDRGGTSATTPTTGSTSSDDPDRHDRREADRVDRAETAEPFEPPPLPPARPLDWLSRLAWAGVLGGPLLVLVTALLSWTLPRSLLGLCMLGFVGGIVVLVARMQDRAPTDDGPDDGAVV